MGELRGSRGLQGEWELIESGDAGRSSRRARMPFRLGPRRTLATSGLSRRRRTLPRSSRAGGMVESAGTVVTRTRLQDAGLGLRGVLHLLCLFCSFARQGDRWIVEGGCLRRLLAFGALLLESWHPLSHLRSRRRRRASFGDLLQLCVDAIPTTAPLRTRSELAREASSSDFRLLEEALSLRLS